MPFDDDNRDADFRRPPVTIRIANIATGEERARIELPELVIPHAELSPEWLAMRDAEQQRNDSGEQDGK
jgi:hypothetical protein